MGMGEESLIAKTGPEGEGSRRVLEKCGFRWYVTEEGEDGRGRVLLDVWRLEREG